MVTYPYQQNNDMAAESVTNAMAAQRGWTSQCEMYRLIRSRATGHVYRFWAGVHGEYPTPEGAEEFFSADPRPYSIVKRLMPGELHA